MKENELDRVKDTNNVKRMTDEISLLKEELTSFNPDAMRKELLERGLKQLIESHSLIDSKL